METHSHPHTDRNDQAVLQYSSMHPLTRLKRRRPLRVVQYGVLVCNVPVSISWWDCKIMQTAILQYLCGRDNGKYKGGFVTTFWLNSRAEARTQIRIITNNIHSQTPDGIVNISEIGMARPPPTSKWVRKLRKMLCLVISPVHLEAGEDLGASCRSVCDDVSLCANLVIPRGVTKWPRDWHWTLCEKWEWDGGRSALSVWCWLFLRLLWLSNSSRGRPRRLETEGQ